MNLNKQIKKHRERLSLSQNDLAEKIYVSRQTISNWENEKSYPDIHNILAMSCLFNISLDQLVKGDLESMKNEVRKSNLKNWTTVLVLLLLGIPVSIGPLIYWLGIEGLLGTILIFIAAIYATYKIQCIKKNENLKNYKDIIKFYDEDKRFDNETYSTSQLKVRIVVFSITFLIIGLITYISLSLVLV